MAKKSANCGTCRYWAMAPNDVNRHLPAECRRWSPIVLKHRNKLEKKAWPKTLRTDWCGDYKAGE